MIRIKMNPRNKMNESNKSKRDRRINESVYDGVWYIAFGTPMFSSENEYYDVECPSWVKSESDAVALLTYLSSPKGSLTFDPDTSTTRATRRIVELFYKKGEFPYCHEGDYDRFMSGQLTYEHDCPRFTEEDFKELPQYIDDDEAAPRFQDCQFIAIGINCGTFVKGYTVDDIESEADYCAAIDDTQSITYFCPPCVKTTSDVLGWLVGVSQGDFKLCSEYGDVIRTHRDEIDEVLKNLDTKVYSKFVSGVLEYEDVKMYLNEIDYADITSIQSRDTRYRPRQINNLRY